MTHHTLTLDALNSEYDAVLKLARSRSVAFVRHLDIDKLVEENAEDLDFFESLIQCIRGNVFLIPPVRR